MATTAKRTKQSATKAAPQASRAPEENLPFARRLLHAINALREKPHSILPALRTQMSHVDEDGVLEVPGREAIQLEEGKSAVSSPLTFDTEAPATVSDSG